MTERVELDDWRTKAILSAIERAYETFDGPGPHCDYHDRHRTASLNVLTVRDPTEAQEIVRGFRDSVVGRRVVEIGSGVGFLALELARYAVSVIAIEVDPVWSWAFTKYLYAVKPPNLTWVFGAAESVANWVRVDLAVIRTRSGVREMVSVAERMAPEIVLSACEQPLVCSAGDSRLRDITAFIERRTEEIIDATLLRGRP